MSEAPYFACFGCTDFAHNQRTKKYVDWACANQLFERDVPPTAWVCTCPEDDAVFTNPVDDNVCWYDPMLPESAEFLGIIITKVSGLRSSTFTRELTDRIDGGSILGAPKITGKSFVFEAVIIATSAPGMDYGLEWLRRLFEDSSLCSKTGSTCTSCQGQNLTMRINCPTEDSVDRGLRTWATAGTVDGVDFVEDDFPMTRMNCNTMRRITWTMSTEQEKSIGPDAVSSCTLAADDPDVFQAINVCTPDPDTSDSCMVDPFCDTGAPFELVPTTIGGLAPCFGDPVCRCMGSISLQDIPAGYDATLRFTLFSGYAPSDAPFTNYGLRNTVIRIWENRQGLPAPVDEETLAAFESTYVPCAELGVSWIPAASELVIDGVSGNSWLKCNGSCYDHSGRIATLGGPLFPMTVHCTDIVATIEWDCLSVQSSSTGVDMPSSATMESFIRYRT